MNRYTNPSVRLAREWYDLEWTQFLVQIEMLKMLVEKSAVPLLRAVFDTLLQTKIFPFANGTVLLAEKRFVVIPRGADYDPQQIALSLGVGDIPIAPPAKYGIDAAYSFVRRQPGVSSYWVSRAATAGNGINDPIIIAADTLFPPIDFLGLIMHEAAHKLDKVNRDDAPRELYAINVEFLVLDAATQYLPIQYQPFISRSRSSAEVRQSYWKG